MGHGGQGSLPLIWCTAPEEGGLTGLRLSQGGASFGEPGVRLPRPKRPIKYGYGPLCGQIGRLCGKDRLKEENLKDLVLRMRA
jgi:hypothetical protein